MQMVKLAIRHHGERRHEHGWGSHHVTGKLTRSWLTFVRTAVTFVFFPFPHVAIEAARINHDRFWGCRGCMLHKNLARGNFVSRQPEEISDNPFVSYSGLRPLNVHHRAFRPADSTDPWGSVLDPST